MKKINDTIGIRTRDLPAYQNSTAINFKHANRKIRQNPKAVYICVLCKKNRVCFDYFTPKCEPCFEATCLKIWKVKVNVSLRTGKRKYS